MLVGCQLPGTSSYFKSLHRAVLPLGPIIAKVLQVEWKWNQENWYRHEPYLVLGVADEKN